MSLLVFLSRCAPYSLAVENACIAEADIKSFEVRPKLETAQKIIIVLKADEGEANIRFFVFIQKQESFPVLFLYLFKEKGGRGNWVFLHRGKQRRVKLYA